MTQEIIEKEDNETLLCHIFELYDFLRQHMFKSQNKENLKHSRNICPFIKLEHFKMKDLSEASDLDKSKGG
jgi:SPX domain protein involved in polyphosphate accumulation